MKVSNSRIISKSTIVFILIVSGFVAAQSNDIRNADPMGFPNINKKSKIDGNTIQINNGIPTKCNSTLSTNPIYIVNGEKIDDLNTINPNKIKSMTIYKGKNAIELYGEEAKNGVIVIVAQEDYLLKVEPKDPNRPEILAI